MNPLMPRGARMRTLAAAALVLLISGTYMLAWIFRWMAVLTPSVIGTPMMFNAALASALLSVALAALAYERLRTAMVVSAPAGFFGVAILLEWYAGIDLHLDNLLVDQGFIALKFLPGRMSPNAALGLTLSFVSVVLLSDLRSRLKLATGTWCAALAGSVGLLSVIGYLSSVDSAYSWGSMTPISLAAAINLIVIGLVLSIRGLRISTVLTGNMPNWTPYLAATAILIASTGMFLSIRNDPNRNEHAMAAAVLGAGVVAVTGFAVILELLRRVRLKARELEIAYDALGAREEELARLSQRLTFAIVGTSEGIWEWDLRSGVVYLSPRWKEMIGYTDQEIADSLEAWKELVHPDDLPDALRELETHIAGDTSHYRVEFRMRHKHGGYRWILSRGKVQRDADGKAVCIAGSHADITESVEMRHALAHESERLARSNAELQQFAYIASHDLQEPLRMVASYTQLLAERYSDQLDERAKKYIRYAVEGASRMQGLINDLLAFSRVGTRAKPLTPTDSANAAQAALDNLRTAIETCGAEIDLAPLPMVMADEGQLMQLFQNLVGNALKFHSPERAPRIRIRADRFGDCWTFCVQDNGIGIEREYWESVFTVFTRLHGRTEFEGNGIGLAICQKIVLHFGGRIWVESTPGTGATFYFTLQAAHETPSFTGRQDDQLIEASARY